MKLIMVNSSLNFKTSNKVTKSVQKTFNAGNVGSPGYVELDLEEVVAANTPITIKATGDSVVASNQWVVVVNNALADAGSYYTASYVQGGADLVITSHTPISSIKIQRSSISSAGTVTLTATYNDTPNEVALTSETKTLEIVSGEGEVEFTFPNALAAYSDFRLEIASAPYSIGLKVITKDANGNTLLNIQKQTGGSSAIGCNHQVPVKSVVVTRTPLGGAVTANVAVTVEYYNTNS